MAEMDFYFQTDKFLKDAKRNCILCYGRARLRPTENERKIAQNAVERMYAMFEERYNELRRKDASTETIQKALEYKRICLDALDACKNCDKEVDNINRMLLKIKK